LVTVSQLVTCYRKVLARWPHPKFIEWQITPEEYVELLQGDSYMPYVFGYGLITDSLFEVPLKITKDVPEFFRGSGGVCLIVEDHAGGVECYGLYS